MSHCEEKDEHKPHLWWRYNSITDEEERVECKGTKVYIYDESIRRGKLMIPLLHCSNWTDHEAHEHINFDIDANRYETVWCDGEGV